MGYVYLSRAEREAWLGAQKSLENLGIFLASVALSRRAAVIDAICLFLQAGTETDFRVKGQFTADADNAAAQSTSVYTGTPVDFDDNVYDVT